MVHRRVTRSLSHRHRHQVMRPEDDWQLDLCGYLIVAGQFSTADLATFTSTPTLLAVHPAVERCPAAIQAKLAFPTTL